MDKKAVPAFIAAVLALIAAIGSCTFLAPCAHEDGSFGPCHWAGRALCGVSIAVLVMALLAIAVKRHRGGIYLSMLPVCALGIFTPGTLISLCGMSTMRCRAVMQPAMIILFSAMLICGAAGTLLELKKR